METQKPSQSLQPSHPMKPTQTRNPTETHQPIAAPYNARKSSAVTATGLNPAVH